MFAVITAAVSKSEQFYVDSWHKVWTTPCAIVLVYYGMNVLNIAGPDGAQVTHVYVLNLFQIFFALCSSRNSLSVR